MQSAESTKPMSGRQSTVHHGDVPPTEPRPIRPTRASRDNLIAATWRPVTALLFIAAGLVARTLPPPGIDRTVWYIGLALTGGGVVWHTIRGAMRGQFAADVVATLAIAGAA